MSKFFQRFLFVCTGNTCRSPMAAALFQAEASIRGLPVTAASAGLAAVPGEPASPHAVTVLAERGISLEAHRSTLLTRDMCDQADVIAVMSDHHRAALLAAGVAADKVIVLAGGIPDPYGGDLVLYRQTRDILLPAVTALLPRLQLRRMEVGHLNALAALEAACFSQPWSETALAEELSNAAARFTVAEDIEGHVRGYLGWHSAGGEGFLANLAVAPDTRRQGIAKWLLCRAITDARAEGLRRLALEVRESNTAAIALYTQLGFVQDGRRPRFYRQPAEDALLYALYLTDKEVSS